MVFAVIAALVIAYLVGIYLTAWLSGKIGMPSGPACLVWPFFWLVIVPCEKLMGDEP